MTEVPTPAAYPPPPKPKPWQMALIILAGTTWMGLIFLGATLSDKTRAERRAKQTTAQSVATQPPKPPQPAPAPKLTPEQKYLDLLRTNMGEVREEGLITSQPDERSTWEAATNLMSSMTDIYDVGKDLELSPAGKAEQQAIKRELLAMQAKAFPELRETYAKALRDKLWEHDVEVDVTGPNKSVLRLSGFWFVSNRPIKAVMEAAQDDVTVLRFNRVEFTGTLDRRTTTFDLHPLPDGAMAKLELGRWVAADAGAVAAGGNR